MDAETGLYYYGARFYDPRISVWLSVDPLAEKTMTPYQYVNNNPVMLIDPTGMNAEDPPAKMSKEAMSKIEIGSVYVDDTGKYKVDNINDGKIEWKSMVSEID